MNHFVRESWPVRLVAGVLVLLFCLSGCMPSIPNVSEATLSPGQSRNLDPTSGLLLFDAASLAKEYPAPVTLGGDSATKPGKPAYNIVVDGSVSMAGYVAKGCNDYLQILDILKSVTFGEPTQYYKFGGSVTAQEQKAFLSSAGLASFYKATSTDISGVFDWITANVLSTQGAAPVVNVLISDLACTDPSQYDEIAAHLMSEYIEPDGKGMALLGVQANYNAKKIYDIPAKGTSKLRSFTVKNGPVKHPVFLLLFGDASGVAALQAAILNKAKEELADQPKVFSLQAVRETAVQSASSLEWDSGMAFYTDEEDPQFVYSDAGSGVATQWLASCKTFRAFSGIALKDGSGNPIVKEPLGNTGGVLRISIPAAYAGASAEGTTSTAKWQGWELSDVRLTARQTVCGQTAAEASFLTLGVSKLALKGGTAWLEVPFTVDVAAMQPDVPVVFDVALNAVPRFNATDKSTGSVKWLADWTMDLDVLEGQADKNFSQYDKAPYLKNLFIDCIWDKFALTQQDALRQFAARSVGNRVTFALVLRDKGDKPWSVPAEKLSQYLNTDKK